MIPHPFKIFIALPLLTIGSARGGELRTLQEGHSEIRQQARELPSIRDFVLEFKADTLPRLNLQGKSARDAISDLGTLDFQCTLVGGGENILDPTKPTRPFVECGKLLFGEKQVYGLIWVYLHIKNWKGDGTPLTARYERLISSQVNHINVSGDPFFGKRLPDNAGVSLDKPYQNLVIAKPGQSISEVAKYAMTHNVSCKATSSFFDRRLSLDCYAIKVISQCRYAVLSIDVINRSTTSTPLSLWSTDKYVSGEQGPWTCLMLQ